MKDVKINYDAVDVESVNIGTLQIMAEEGFLTLCPFRVHHSVCAAMFEGYLSEKMTNCPCRAFRLSENDVADIAITLLDKLGYEVELSQEVLKSEEEEG